MQLTKLSDPKWRLSHLYSIVDKNASRVRFAPNAIQARLNEEKANRKIILKARQFGISTNELIKQFDYTITHRNITSCILAHEKDGIEKLFRIVRRAYDFMDPRLKPDPGPGGGSKYELYFPEINSRIYCDLESRGDTIHWLHISEAAFFKQPDRMKSTIQAVPLNGRVTIETTPNGMGNHFYDLWTDTTQPYDKIFYPWFLFPEYSIDGPEIRYTEEEKEFVAKAKERFQIEITQSQVRFRRFKKAELGRIFIQEYPEDDQSCFLATGSAAMDLMIVKDLLDQAPEPMETRGVIKFYEKPYSDGRYVVGADVAEGVASDYSAACVIDARTFRQVATIKAHLKPTDFADWLVELCEAFKVRAQLPLLAVERNNHGHAVLLKLNETLQYPNLYVGKDEKLGWLTDKNTRPLMIDRFIEAVEHGHLKLLDKETLQECLTLVDNDTKIEAAEGKHDDTVIASAIANFLATEQTQLSSVYDNIGSKILV